MKRLKRCTCAYGWWSVSGTGHFEHPTAKTIFELVHLDGSTPPPRTRPAMRSTCTWCWLRTFYKLGEPNDLVSDPAALELPPVSSLQISSAQRVDTHAPLVPDISSDYRRTHPAYIKIITNPNKHADTVLFVIFVQCSLR